MARQYLTPDEYAAKHGVSGACVRAWINDGLLEAVPPSPSYRIPADAPRPATKLGRPLRKKVGKKSPKRA